jgi:NADH dehydrogenase
MRKHQVVIIGGGFGGLYAAQRLRRAPLEITLVDRRNFHLFQPLLYQVATGGLSPGDIASALRWVLRRQRNVRVWLAEATSIDAARGKVQLTDDELPFDTLIVATGVSHHYFGQDHWERHAPGLKTIEDATDIRCRVLAAFEAAEREPDGPSREAWLTFAVVGGGPTGVELAGAIAELAKQTMRSDFRAVDTTRARILLLEGGDRVLPGYPPDLSAKAVRSLARLGVDVHTEPHHLVGGRYARHTPGPGCGRRRGRGAGLSRPRHRGARPHRARTSRDLRHRGPRPFRPPDGRATPRSGAGGDGSGALRGFVDQAPVARALRGAVPVPRQGPARHYRTRRCRCGPAWLLWLFVHLMYLVEFENRVLVFFRWAWNYFTRHRGARLIAHRASGHSISSDHDRPSR